VAIAFDGSPESRAALEAGYALAARDGAAVTLLRALPRIPDGVATDDERLQLRLRAQAELDAAADSAPAGVNPRARLLHGDPRKVLAEACDGLVDLVVCGSHGYGALQRAVLGSVSASLLAGASQPVLVIRSARAARAPD
jgi:nucleotide-binding universal stress UspA family protein